MGGIISLYKRRWYVTESRLQRAALFVLPSIDQIYHNFVLINVVYSQFEAHELGVSVTSHKI